MASTDPYLSDSGVLRNLLDLTDREALAIAEVDFAEARSLEWEGAEVPSFDADHLFQDIYDWAGTFRTVGIGKSGPDGFWPWDSLERRATKVFDALRDGPLLDVDVDGEPFALAIASLYLEINYLHPFREGNGRTQRIFLNEVASMPQRVIEWRWISRLDNDRACAESVSTQSASSLRALLTPVISTEQDHATRVAMGQAGLARTNEE
jgi:cell filamentation protein